MSRFEPAPLHFVVQPGDPVLRLDLLVVSLLARNGIQVSRNVVRLWIAHQRVSIDGHSAKASSRAAVGTRVSVHPEAPPPSDAQPDASIPVQVLHQDEHLIVIDKPAGLVVHPARGHESGTLVNGLLAHASFDEDAVDNADPEGMRRPGIVHRLDKDTSGVLVVARTARAREGLKALFAKHDIDREYRAVVVGNAVSATYDTPFGRHPTDRLRFSTKARAPFRRAVTHVRVVETLAGGRATMLACTLETGRTHQIRVHLSECGKTPVLGDALYGGRLRDVLLARLAGELGRHFLHAAVLGFVHPCTGQRLRFESPLPPELQRALAELRATP